MVIRHLENAWFWASSLDVQEEILQKIHVALKWRGWDAPSPTRPHQAGLGGCHAQQAINEIGELLWDKSRTSVEEYL